MSDKFKVEVVYYAVQPRDLPQEELEAFFKLETQAALARLATATSDFAAALRKVGESRLIPERWTNHEH